MAALQIEPELIAPRDWLAHYRDVLARRRKPATIGREGLPEREPEKELPTAIMRVPDFRPETRAEKIIREVAVDYRVRRKALLSASRKGLHVMARRVLIVRLRDELGMSYPSIGRLIGRDHSTVLHAYYQHKAGVKPYPNAGDISRIRNAKPQAVHSWEQLSLQITQNEPI